MKPPRWLCQAAMWLFKNEWIPLPSRCLPYLLGLALGSWPRRVR